MKNLSKNNKKKTSNLSPGIKFYPIKKDHAVVRPVGDPDKNIWVHQFFGPEKCIKI